MVFDSIVHRWKDESRDNCAMVKVGRGIPVGSNVRATSRSAFENGLPVHIPTVEHIFDFIFQFYSERISQLNAQHGIAVVMTEMALLPPYCRQEMLELLFEGYSCVERVSFVLDGPSSLPLTSENALNIHVGAVCTHVYPVIKGVIDWVQVKRIHWGGVVAAEFLLKIMGFKYPGILNSTNPNKLTPSLAQAIWQKTCLIAADISTYESKMDALSKPNDSTLKTLNCCIRLSGDAFSEAERKRAVCEAKKAAELNQVALQEKRKILADKLRQKSEEQRSAKIRSKEHIYKALQGLLDRVQVTLKQNSKTKKSKQTTNKSEDEDISMEFSENEEEISDSNDVIFSSSELSGDSKLFEELKRLGFKSFNGLQEGLKRAEEEFFRLSGQATSTNPQVFDFSILNVPDNELNEVEIKEKRRLRLIKSSADAREKQKIEKIAEDAKRQAAAKLLELKRIQDLEGWRGEIYGKRRELIDRLIRRQKQRADRKGVAQGSRFRSVVALGDSTEETGNPGVNPSGGSNPSEGGPDDGFGLNDDDWLVYRQVSRDDEEDSDLHDQEVLALIEGLLEEKDHEEFMRRLKEEQYASLTLLDRLTFGGETDIAEIVETGQPTIHINAERLRCTEGLFQPLSVQGIDQAGLAEIISNLISSYPYNIQSTLVQNVHVSGGSANIPGLHQRLTNELSAALLEDLVPLLSINMCPDLEGPWKGIKSRLNVQGGAELFHWISRSEYLESRAVSGLEPSIEANPNKNNNKNKKNNKKKKSTTTTTISSAPISQINYENIKSAFSNPY